jgi:copper chaperone CopZ
VPKVIGALAGLPGIIETEAFYPEKEARVVYDPGLIGIEQIIQTLSQAGYSAAIKEDWDSPPSLGIVENQDGIVFKPDELVCYCFGYTRGDIEKDFLQNGRSLIMGKIAAEKKTGGCDCANRNPKGR